jgi:2,3-bisphosphoglycerate-independent phosphoglycerate mutase
MKKILYVVLDGLGDTPIKELGDKTPLEAALTPNMDKLAQMGKSGVIYPVARGVAPESDIAVISLLGYDAGKYYTGRGPLESFAEGLKVEDGNVALRVNFATVEEDSRKIKDRRVGRDLTTEEAAMLAREINAKVVLTNATFEFKNTVGHRGILVIRGMHSQLSAWITNTDPAYGREGVFGLAKEEFEPVVGDSQPMPGHEDEKPAIEAAALLNEFTQKSRQVLEESAVNKKRIADGKLPASGILSRDAGDRLPKFPPMEELYKVRFGSFVEMPIERGIALLTGITIVDVPSSTGHADVDYSIWAKVALQKIQEFDGLYIHIKGPDEPGHDGDFKKKKAFIEAIDKHFFGSLLPGIDLKDFVLAVTGDHSTPCKLRAHSADPAPLIISGGSVKSDKTLSFSEKACREGSLGEVLGKDLMGMLIKFAKS